MERVLAELRGKFCFVYIDDIIIYSQSREQHDQHLNAVMQRLHSKHEKKCHFFKCQLKFLGYVVSNKGMEIDPEKTWADADNPPPKDLKSLHQCLGLAVKERLVVVWAVENGGITCKEGHLHTCIHTHIHAVS